MIDQLVIYHSVVIQTKRNTIRIKNDV